MWRLWKPPVGECPIRLLRSPCCSASSAATSASPKSASFTRPPLPGHAQGLSSGRHPSTLSPVLCCCRPALHRSVPNTAQARNATAKNNAGNEQSAANTCRNIFRRTQQQVGGLDVAVQDARRMHGRHAGRDVQRQGHHLPPPRPPALPRNPLFCHEQCAAVISAADVLLNAPQSCLQPSCPANGSGHTC